MRRGFTLIELLVVIAIIAILAAILFPVFAQVREKARQISCVSNEKQLVLGILQYTEDYDETYPFGQDTGNGVTGDYNHAWGGVPDKWDINIAPYVKSLSVFYCPDDSETGSTYNDWQGLGMSYAVNGLILVNWGAGTNTNVGPMGMANDDFAGHTQSVPGGGLSLAAVTQPTSSILLSEEFSSDIHTASPTDVNATAFGDSGIFGRADDRGSGFENIPDGNPSYAGGTYPNGPNGGVSAHHVSNTLANFAFCDGHVKSMHPTDTNPNGAAQPQNNMWNATR